MSRGGAPKQFLLSNISMGAIFHGAAQALERYFKNAPRYTDEAEDPRPRRGKRKSILRRQVFVDRSRYTGDKVRALQGERGCGSVRKVHPDLRRSWGQIV